MCRVPASRTTAHGDDWGSLIVGNPLNPIKKKKKNIPNATKKPSEHPKSPQNSIRSDKTHEIHMENPMDTMTSAQVE
jgi:hypothetical protein